MNRILQTIGLSLGLATAGVASAGLDDGRSGGYDRDGYDWARVVHVDPIIERFDEPYTRDVCFNQPTEYYEPRYAYQRGDRRNGTGGALLGALIGGALGNQVGKGDGRRAATIAGALIGGSIGHDRATRGRYRDVGGHYVRGNEQACEPRTEYRSREQVTGYEVTYEYNGRRYRTTTVAHPGDRIQVAISVDAVP